MLDGHQLLPLKWEIILYYHKRIIKVSSISVASYDAIKKNGTMQGTVGQQIASHPLISWGFHVVFKATSTELWVQEQVDTEWNMALFHGQKWQKKSQPPQGSLEDFFTTHGLACILQTVQGVHRATGYIKLNYMSSMKWLEVIWLRYKKQEN